MIERFAYAAARIAPMPYWFLKMAGLVRNQVPFRNLVANDRRPRQAAGMENQCRLQFVLALIRVQGVDLAIIEIHVAAGKQQRELIGVQRAAGGNVLDHAFDVSV